jgi:hypothetical protein
MGWRDSDEWKSIKGTLSAYSEICKFFSLPTALQKPVCRAVDSQAHALGQRPVGWTGFDPSRTPAAIK